MLLGWGSSAPFSEYIFPSPPPSLLWFFKVIISMLFPCHQFLWTWVHNDSQQGGTERATTRSFFPGGASQCCLLCSNLKHWLNGTRLKHPFLSFVHPRDPRHGDGSPLSLSHPAHWRGVWKSGGLPVSRLQHWCLQGWTGGFQASGHPYVHPPVKALRKKNQPILARC